MENLKEADVVVVTDTGSTDNTISLLKEHGAIVHETNINPWRFDIARNISLDNVPEDVDVCLCIDLDEVITPGWRGEIEKSWLNTTTRLRYKYIWGPGTEFWYDKIHLRKGYKWVNPVHEVLVYEGLEVQTYCNNFTVHHYPDNTKSRSSYLPLLELSCQEDQNNDRNSHYLGREYMYYGHWDKAIIELQRHLSLPTAKWTAERCASMRFIARCYCKKNDNNTALVWALKACSEHQIDREPWIKLGKVYYNLQNWVGTYYAMMQALAITEKEIHYITEVDSWNEVPYDYASIAAWNMGLKNDAITLVKEAIKLNPNNDRLKNNLIIFKGE
jgi:glycosyltransferase involved in cell wall biosynthesis